MKTNNYFQPQTCVECAIPQMVILVGSHETGGLPEGSGSTPQGPGLGAPRKTV